MKKARIQAVQHVTSGAPRHIIGIFSLNYANEYPGTLGLCDVNAPGKGAMPHPPIPTHAGEAVGGGVAGILPQLAADGHAGRWHPREEQRANTRPSPRRWLTTFIFDLRAQFPEERLEEQLCWHLATEAQLLQLLRGHVREAQLLQKRLGQAMLLFNRGGVHSGPTHEDVEDVVLMQVPSIVFGQLNHCSLRQVTEILRLQDVVVSHYELDAFVHQLAELVLDSNL
mmetsp:Transcript_85761/g.136210  ORF Transcript_85761/g.136210 Transcript_85761/m.136210 type:complete len:226 (-) Transcript_85761:486-1163(-)